MPRANRRPMLLALCFQQPGIKCRVGGPAETQIRSPATDTASAFRQELFDPPSWLGVGER